MSDSVEPLVQIRDLRVTYAPDGGDPVRALEGVNLDIARGEIVGILGESGCGKSTLASALLHLLPAHPKCEAGSVLIDGCNLMQLSERELRSVRGKQVSMIPQDPALSLNPVMTVGSQIAEVLRAHLSLTATERRLRVMELLRAVGFNGKSRFDNPQDIYSAYPSQLSGGQRQRIAIAQAISCRPAFLIADEPTSKSDASLQAEIIALLSHIRQQHGTAILLISHDPALFAGFADRIAIMYAGRIVEVGNTASVFRNPLHPYTQALVRIAKFAVMPSGGNGPEFKSADTKAPLPAIAGESPDPTSVAPGCRFESRCPERMEVCSIRYPNEFLPEPSRPVSCFKYGY